MADGDFDEAGFKNAISELKSARAAVAALPKPPKGTALPEVAQQLKKMAAELAALEKKCQANIALLDKEIARAKQEGDRDFDMKSYQKEYAKCVKETDGLTSLRPSCVKAFETFNKTPTVGSAEKIVEALDKHAADLVKETKDKVKSDKEAKKSLDAFTKSINSLTGRLTKAINAAADAIAG